MTHKPEHWTATDLRWIDVSTVESLLHQACGWSFFEHPTEGDEHPVLAMSLDYITEEGPVVWNTHDYDVPEYL